MGALVHETAEQSGPDAGRNVTEPQRIVIISDAWAPQVNGVVRSYENLRRELHKAGHVVRVISPVEFGTVPLPGYGEIRLALFPYRRLSAMITAFAPTAVHIAVEGPLGWAARRYCLRRGIPFSTAFHTNFPAYVALRAPRVLRGMLERMTLAFVRRFHAPAHHTFVSTASIEAQMRGWGFTGCLVRLSRGVDPEQFFPVPDRPASVPPVLLYVGRVAPEKNLDGFLGLTEAQTGPARKVVVGEGPALAKLRLAYPDVTFHGMLTGTALANAYRCADVFVFPSRTDTFGIVLIEALASGLPVAAHNVPGPRDLVTDPGLGALDDDLGAAIRRALQAPGSRSYRHAHARKIYSWESMAATFLRHCPARAPSSRTALSGR